MPGMSQPSRARNRTRGTFAGTIAVNVASVTGRAGSAIALTRVPGEGLVQAALASPAAITATRS
jgi:hypothetical protein